MKIAGEMRRLFNAAETGLELSEERANLALDFFFQSSIYTVTDISILYQRGTTERAAKRIKLSLYRSKY